MSWSNAYIGLPWADPGHSRAGVSCWGLVVLVYAEHLGIALPTYEDEIASSAERAEIAAVMARESAALPWRPVERGAERPFDVLLFRRGPAVEHAALVVRPGVMLHISDGQTSRIESYESGRWVRRLGEIVRHAEAPAC